MRPGRRNRSLTSVDVMGVDELPRVLNIAIASCSGHLRIPAMRYMCSSRPISSSIVSSRIVLTPPTLAVVWPPVLMHTLEYGQHIGHEARLAVARQL